MKSRTTAEFRALLHELPAHVRLQAHDAYLIIAKNPRHPGLRFKRLQGADTLCSARVGMRYRAVGRIEGDTVIWFWIGAHAEYNHLLTRL